MTYFSEQELKRLVELEAEAKCLREKLTLAIKERFDADKRRYCHRRSGMFLRVTEVGQNSIEFCYSEDHDPDDLAPEYSSMDIWWLGAEEGDESNESNQTHL